MHPASSAVALAKYLRNRLERLAHCNTDFETRVSEDKAELCRKVTDGIYKRHDPELGRAFFHLEYVLANTFRSCMLTAVCSFLEEALKAIGSILSPAYDKELDKQKHRGRWLCEHKDQRSKPPRNCWLDRHLFALQEMAGGDFHSVERSVNMLFDLIMLRNCAVHSGGNVAKDRDPGSIRAAVKHINTSDIAEISRDDFLIFGDQVAPEGIIAAEEVIDYILSCTLGRDSIYESR